MSTLTPNLSLHKPDPNNPTDDDVWGGMLNGNADILDAAVQAAQDAATAADANASTRLPASAVSAFGAVLIDAADAATARQTLGAAPAGGFRNRLINGDFRIWQRGTFFNVTTSGQYGPDRWRWDFNGSAAARTISMLPFTPGQTDIPGAPKCHCRVTQALAGSGGTVSRFGQFIEDVLTLSGSKATLSLWLRGGPPFTLPGLDLVQVFGTGGSTEVTTVLASNLPITTSWQRFVFTADIPSLLGKTIGTSDALLFVVRMPLNAAFTLDIARPQIEDGPYATAFELRPDGMELALCQRYFWKPPSMTAVGYSAGAGLSLFGTVWHPVTMRVAPTVSGAFSSGVNVNTPSVTGASIHGFQTAATAAAAGGYSYVYTANNTVSAEY